MRPLRVVAAVVCGVFVLAGAASASVREEVRSLAGSVAAVASMPDDAVPSLEPSPSDVSPSPDPSLEGTESAPGEETPASLPSETATLARNHGAAVSAVARNKEATGEKTLPNGKVITNHGMAVSAAAHDKGGGSSSK